MTDKPKAHRGQARRLKHQQRAQGPSEKSKPVRPGLLGGDYKPLTENELLKVHHAVLDVLERVGIGEPPPLFIELASSRGCTSGNDGRLRFPRSFVDEVIDKARKEFVLYARDSRHDLEIASSRVHFGTGGAAVQILDLDSNKYRSPTIVDLYDCARLVDTLDNVHWFTRCCIATDIEDLFAFDISTAYACVAGTQKHIGTAISLPEHVKPIVEMFDAVAGGEGKFKQRPFCKVHASPIISPLRFGEDAAGVMVEAIKYGMPINAITAGQSGATAPATLAGALVQTTAETLSALIFVHLIDPNHPFIFSNWPFVSDLRTGSFSGGGGEEAILNAASAQMINHYGLPSGIAAGMADSKLPDAQAGYEKALTTVLAGASGANLVYESAGMLGSLLGCSFESFVIDNEMLSSVLRAVRGIEINDETLAVDVIEQTVNDPGHYLGADQTIAIMESEYVYPVLGDRTTPTEWQENGATDIRQRAQDQVNEILTTHYPQYIEPGTDKQLRERFPIKLPLDSMVA